MRLNLCAFSLAAYRLFRLSTRQVRTRLDSPPKPISHFTCAISRLVARHTLLFELSVWHIPFNSMRTTGLRDQARFQALYCCTQIDRTQAHGREVEDQFMKIKWMTQH